MAKRRKTSKNPRYFLANRRTRRNSASVFGADLVKDVAMPVAAGTGGFVAARALSNGVAGIGAVRGILDKDMPASDATNTKILANLLGIGATLYIAPKVKVIKDNQGAIIVGMGLALLDRLIQKMNLSFAMGEYVSQPVLGEYVSQPVLGGFGEYVSQPVLGEYVSQPVLGDEDPSTMLYDTVTNPSSDESVDSLMDVAEAAAGVGEIAEAAAGDIMYATAGDDIMYATAGFGDVTPASMAASKIGPPIKNFVPTFTPDDGMRFVTTEFPYARPVSDRLMAPEATSKPRPDGQSSGIFTTNLFSGML